MTPNVWTQQHVAFGHKRLIVIDPQGGRQPMTREKMNSSMRLTIMEALQLRKIFGKNY